ncbi:uncharacterized protein LOC114464883 isoform X2 [Gouania willdenowi]|nr:uncharacterized protein LOC114464883 isoform X2 [Gouania willdenowi]
MLQSHHAISEKEILPSKINYLSNENKFKQSQNVVTKQKEEKMCSQKSFNLEDAPQSCSKKSPIVFKDPMHEDVSDVENHKQPDKKLASPGFDESSNSVVCEDDSAEEESFPDHSPIVLKYPMYEDISDIEDNKQLGKKLASQDFCTKKERPLKQNGFTCNETDIQLISDDEPIPDTESTDTGPNCCCPYLVETETGFECPKCQNKKGALFSSQSKSLDTKSLSFSEGVKANLDGQTSPVLILENNDQDDLEDDWLVIPLVVSDIRLDQPCEDQTETEVLSAQGEDGDEEKKGWGTPLNFSASNSFHQSQYFNTAESCGQVQDVGHEHKAHISMSCDNSDLHSDTSNETDDSCNYSPTRERNLLTVPRQIWASRSLSSPLQLNNDFHLEEKHGHEMTNTQRVKLQNKTPKIFDTIESHSDEVSEIRNEARKNPSNEKRELIGSSVTNIVSYEDASTETSGKTTNLSVDAGSSSGVKLGKKNANKYQHDPFENGMQSEASGFQFDKIDGQCHEVKSSSNYALPVKNATKAYKRKQKAISRHAKKVRAHSPFSAATEDTEDACSNASDSFGGESKDDSVAHDKLAGVKHETQTLLKRMSELTKEQPKAPIKKPKPLDSSENETEDSEDLSDASDNISNTKKNQIKPMIEKCGFQANKNEQASNQCVEQCLPSTSKLLDNTFKSKPELKSCQGISGSRPQMSKYIRSFSYPSSSGRCITLSANDKVKESWKEGHIETKIHRRARLGREDMTSKMNLVSKLAPSTSKFSRAPKKRHNSQKSETPLMKKTRSEAKERTREIKCHRLKHQSNPVARHNKWKEPEDKAVSRRKKRCPSPSLLED